MAKKTVRDIDVAGKKVFVRVDFNVPIDAEGNVSDDKRIVAALPTIQYLLDHNAKVILCSHLGRPKGKVNKDFSLAPVAKRLKELLPDKVINFAEDTIGPSAHKAIDALHDGEIALLENVRFHAEEEKNDPAFAKELASLADVYVSDAFGTVHRAHASTAGIASFIPAVAGFLIGKELDIMGKALEDPERPFIAILGGAKVSDKIAVIKNLLNKCDCLIIGGGMAYTFLKAQGHSIGSSLLDSDNIGFAKDLLKEAEEKNVTMLLPEDHVIADRFDAEADKKVTDGVDIPDGWMGMDIGPKTAAKYAEAIKKAKTVVWNGPMGVFEFKPFAEGTQKIAEACAECGGVTIVGGGDSASAVKKLGFANKITHISTGGGASLEFLEGKILPGDAALNDK